MAGCAISVRGLRMSYDGHEVVRGIDLEVADAEVFAFLGPNGAGKTTTVEVLEGYRKRTGGEVAVLGVDPARAGRAWRARVGVVLQESDQDPDLTVRETVAEAITPVHVGSRTRLRWLGSAISAISAPSVCRAVSSAALTSRSR